MSVERGVVTLGRPPQLKKILVVEDEASIANLIAYNLDQDGYQVQTALDGQQACMRAETFNPNVVTLDLLLPLASGWQVLRFLRAPANPRLARVPIIVVSALSCARQQAELERHGVQHCVGKPFSVTELSRLIHQQTSRPDETNQPGED